MNIRTFTKVLIMLCCNIIATLLAQKKEPSVLMYHSFDTTNWRHGVSPANLKKQIAYLLEKRTIVPLVDIVLFVKGEKELPKNAVAITVDDGYEDTYTVLFPLAKKYNIPFTLFLTTNLFQQKKLGNLPRPTADQLHEMVDSKIVELGVHGHSHINFPEVLQKGIEREEITVSREILRNEYGQSANFVAYPAGKYNTDVTKYLREQKYTSAFTTHIASLKKYIDIMLIPRILVDRNTTFLLFKLRLFPGLAMYTAFADKIKRLYAKIY